MLKYHGTPITPRSVLHELAGRNFCVSYAEPRDVAICHEIGQSVMLDNGAFSVWKRGMTPDWPGFCEWARPWLEYRTTWAVMPDVIDGTEQDNDDLIVWLFKHDREVFGRSAPVWHMHESLERLRRLCGGYERVCIGSSGEYAVLKTPQWYRRMDEAFNVVCGNGSAPVWLHMLRGLDMSDGPYPFASVDSTNIAQNHARQGGVPAMAQRWDGRNPAKRWHVKEHPEALFASPMNGTIHP